MKVLVLSPYFAPQMNGLSDYSTIFCSQLSKSGHEVDIICNKGLGRDSSVFFEANRWNLFTFLKLLREMKASKKNWDKIIIQFVPHMYSSKGGLVPSIGIFALLCKFLYGPRLQVMFHELHYPFSFYWKDALMWLCHHFMYVMCLWCSQEAFFSTQTNLKKGRHVALRDNCHWLPVGSNISRFKGLIGHEGHKNLKVCLFGGLHVSKRYDLVFQILNEEMEIEFIGLEKEDLPLELQKHPMANHINFLGKCDSHEVAERIAKSDLMIAYFSDGLSSRRGSAMAALNQGIHLLSSYDWGSEELFLHWPNIHLFPARDEDFLKGARAFLTHFFNSDSKEIILSSQQRKAYQEHFDHLFSWDVILKRYIDLSC